MPEYVHVKDKETGHEYVVAEHLFDGEVHEKTGKPARLASGDLAPMKPKTSVAKQAAAKKAAKKAAPSGQQAETEEE